ncbi:proline-rich protein 2-like [Plodia interpunctella]|uniref:proline-rich protein 2-like n=1 Tax=Plodia interpunctella TaxID=58824 RepID=UPI002368A01D|nr:proline-rich protein 2-like [Plodia interpunctella]
MSPEKTRQRDRVPRSKSIALEEPKSLFTRTEPVVVVAAAEDDPPLSPPPPMGLKERRGSRGSPCANLPPLMLPPSTPEPSPSRLSPNRLSPQPKEPQSAPIIRGNPPRRSRTRSEMPPDPPPRSPQTPRPASVSPKHTFAFKIVLKKVESTPNTSFDRPDQ